MTKKTKKTKMKNQSLQIDLLKKIAEHFKSEDEEVVKEFNCNLKVSSKKMTMKMKTKRKTNEKVLSW